LEERLFLLLLPLLLLPLIPAVVGAHKQTRIVLLTWNSPQQNQKKKKNLVVMLELRTLLS